MTAASGRGRFITLEGPEGSGKSTAARHLADWLVTKGVRATVTAEPGGTRLGEEIRRLVLHARSISDDLDPRADALLFAAGRAQHVARKIRPALEAGEWVVCARYLDSSLAYQGIGRELGVDRVLELNLVATGGLLPDRTFLLDLPVDEAARRRGGDSDRLEAEGRKFAERVGIAYRELAAAFPRRIVRVDATRPPEEQAEIVRAELRDGS